MDKLIFKNYLEMKPSELTEHPDYSPHAMRIVQAVYRMPTDLIEKLDITGVK